MEDAANKAEVETRSRRPSPRRARRRGEGGGCEDRAAADGDAIAQAQLALAESQRAAGGEEARRREAHDRRARRREPPRTPQSQTPSPTSRPRRWRSPRTRWPNRRWRPSPRETRTSERTRARVGTAERETSQNTIPIVYIAVEGYGFASSSRLRRRRRRSGPLAPVALATTLLRRSRGWFLRQRQRVLARQRHPRRVDRSRLRVASAAARADASIVDRRNRATNSVLASRFVAPMPTRRSGLEPHGSTATCAGNRPPNAARSMVRGGISAPVIFG